MARFIIACMAFAVSQVTLPAQEKREDRSPGPGITRAGSEKLPTDLKKEGISLPLTLKEGATYSFLLEGHQEAAKGSEPSILPDKPRSTTGETEPGEKVGGRESQAGSAMVKELSLKVVKKEGDAWVLVGICRPRGASPSDKDIETATVSVAKDGKVTCLEADGKPRVETKPLDPQKAHMKTHMEHLFGYRLHDAKLEPGKEYTMPGSIHDLIGHHGTAGAGTLPGQPEKSSAKEESPPRPGETGSSTLPGATASVPGQGGDHRMRFEGVSSTDRRQLVWFTILPGAAGKPGEASPRGTGAGEKPGASDKPGTQEGVTTPRAGDRLAGVAAYAVDDGLLEKLAIGGMTVRRLPPARFEPGN